MKPWGHKVTVVIYVEGAFEDANDVAQLAEGAADVMGVGFIGTKIDEVSAKPTDQVAS